MKIIKKEPIGFLPVYDIGLLQDHNFLIKGNVFASNCFNKSHSVAYGYITYQTAYLKANYPVEYMAALLSSVSDDQDKVQRYIASCNSMGITILPPDINTSDVNFTPQNQNIIFGLAAIKNLGMGAIEAILTARQEGPFKSLGDLCKRVDSRALNKKALEALVQAGAFDRIHPNRKQTMASIEPTLNWAVKRSKDKASGQGSLFDMFSSGAPEEDIFDAPPTCAAVEDYLPQEKLQLEKELLGFYVSDHPLKSISKSARLLAPINLTDLEAAKEDVTVTAIVILTEIKNVTTKKGDTMAILQLEDLSGSAEAVVFPKVYGKVREFLQKDNRVIVWGKVDRKEETAKLFIDDMQKIADVSLVRLELKREQALDSGVLEQLREVLRPHGGGKVPVIIQIKDLPKMVRVGNQFWVQEAQSAVQALQRAGFTAFTDFLVPTNSLP